MADSYWIGTASGTTALFAVPFPYIRQADVVVQMNGIVRLAPGDYTWVNAGSIQFNAMPEEGVTVAITRNTSPDSILVSFSNGAVLTAADLNLACLQNFYRTQELQDQINGYITDGVQRYQITGTNPGMTPTDLINAAADAVLASTLAQELLGASTDIALNAQNILDQTTRVDTLQATFDQLSSNVPGGIGTYLTNETDARIAGDAALATVQALIGAVSGGGATFTLDTTTVYVDGTTSMADKFSAIASEIAGNTAAITSEATTRASADSAMSTLITGLTSSVGANAAAIATEATTRATADSANASSITSLTTTVSGHTTSISSQLSSIDGLEAEYTVKIDADGNVAGYGLASGIGGVSQFTVLANKFSVIDPGAPGGTPTVPFSISGGIVFMQDVVIGGALIQDATITSAKIGGLQVATPNIANNAATAVTGATISNGNTSTSTAVIYTLNYNSSGGVLIADFLFTSDYNATFGSTYTITVDGTTVATYSLTSGWGNPVQQLLRYVGQPAAGFHTIAVNASTHATWLSPTFVLEFKK